MREAADKGRFENEGWRLRKDGSRFWADVVISAVRNAQGELLGFVKLTRDLTERKRAEQTLLKSRHMFEGLFENSPDTVILVNQAGCIVRVNARIDALFGYTRVELEGRSVETLIPERYRAGHGAHLAGYFAAPRARSMDTGLELFAMRKDGSEFPADIMLSPLETDEGNHVLAVVRDITTRKEAEERIHNLNKELKQRASMLEVANQELEAFCYSVSHDLRAPLRGIDGFSHALLEDYADKLDATGRDSLQRIRGGCQRMAKLIDDLLNLSRLSRSEMHWRPVDLSKLAREVAHELRETAPERVAQFHIAEDLKSVGDRGLLRVALWNLLANAWKFTGKAAETVIEFGVRRSDGHAIYFVRDNGPGFDMTYADKLFKPFQRLHAMTEFPGSGIGLATVGRVIHRHGGRVWVEAVPGQGATFYFTLEQEGEQHGQQ